MKTLLFTKNQNRNNIVIPIPSFHRQIVDNLKTKKCVIFLLSFFNVNVCFFCLISTIFKNSYDFSYLQDLLTFKMI